MPQVQNNVSQNLLGSFSFSASGGAISGLVVTGAITNVERLAVGKFKVTHSVGSLDYAVGSPLASDDNAKPTFCYYAGTSAEAKTTTYFQFFTYGYSAATSDPRDPQLVEGAIFKR